MTTLIASVAFSSDERLKVELWLKLSPTTVGFDVRAGQSKRGGGAPLT